jgi:hypothetical protein
MKIQLKSSLLILMLAGSLVTKAQVPIINSYPSASAVIFLDFDGHTVPAGSWWGGPIYCAASGLSNTLITEIFNRVAEDYRPFNINVTTDSLKYLAAPLTKRMRVIITPTYEWYGTSGGVAFIGSFNWGDDTPCFVFSSLLSNNPKYVAEATSHEAGHTLGLEHQSTYDGSCVKTAEYNPGVGAGEIGWAPIMGVGYSKNLTLWNNGTNSVNCTEYQNDLAIISNNAVNGFTYRIDDHANDTTGATFAPFVSNVFNVAGTVERNTDADFIKINMTTAGRFQLNAIPYNVGSGNSGSDLDLQVSLYNNLKVLLNVYNPGTLLNSVVDTMMNAGNYFLKIEGRGNIYAPNYASLGSYALQGTFTGGALPLRKLELHGEIVSDKHKLTWFIDADEVVTKQILEVSTDGRNFNPVTQTDMAIRSYLYKPYVSTTAQYRLNVTFDNGHQYYSNTVTLRNTGTISWPKLVTNITTDNIVVTSPGTYSYSIFEFNGKVINKGQLMKGLNTINTPAIAGGMYFIRFSNGTEQWIDKFLKQ